MISNHSGHICASDFPALMYSINMENLVQRDPDILSGMPVFSGTRVPVKNLFDYLSAGSSIDEFVDDFPTVGHDTVVNFLKQLELQTTTIDPAA